MYNTKLETNKKNPQTALITPFKRKCPLKPSEDKKGWHMMKKKKFFIFHTKIAYHTVRNVVGFFS